MTISPIDVNNTLEYVFGEDFDACNIVVIKQINKSPDQTPHYVIKNPSKDLPIEVCTLKITLAPCETIDLVKLPKFQKRKITALKDFIAENEEFRILVSAGLIIINENIFRPPIYDKNYFVSVFRWEGNPVEGQKYSDLDADQVGMVALRAYMKHGKDHRCISCLQYPHGLIQYFREMFPSEIESFREDGIPGYDEFKIKYMREFENADSKLAIEAKSKDIENGIHDKTASA